MANRSRESQEERLYSVLRKLKKLNHEDQNEVCIRIDTLYDRQERETFKREGV